MTDETKTDEQPQSTGSTAQDVAARYAEVIKQTVSARGNIYGTPEENFGNVANFWQCYLAGRYGAANLKAAGIQILPQDVGYMFALTKIARLIKTPMHPDTALDAAVYTLLGHGCAVDLDQKIAAALKAAFMNAAAEAPPESPQENDDSEGKKEMGDEDVRY